MGPQLPEALNCEGGCEAAASKDDIEAAIVHAFDSALNLTYVNDDSRIRFPSVRFKIYLITWLPRLCAAAEIDSPLFTRAYQLTAIALASAAANRYCLRQAASAALFACP